MLDKKQLCFVQYSGENNKTFLKFYTLVPKIPSLYYLDVSYLRENFISGVAECVRFLQQADDATGNIGCDLKNTMMNQDVSRQVPRSWIFLRR